VLDLEAQKEIRTCF